MSIVNEPQIKSIVERVERLHEDRKAIASDISEIYKEARGNGFDPKVLKKVVAYRAQDRDKRQQEGEIFDLYLSALGEV